MNPSASEIDQSKGDSGAVFELKIDDSSLLNMVSGPLSASQNYWEKTFGLAKVREKNLNMWLPNHWKDKDYYDYQEGYLYQDPRIFLSVETICSVVNARVPQPEAKPAQDTVVSQQLAKDLQSALFAHSEKYGTNDIFRIATRNLLLKRANYVKLRFDPNIGEHGDIVPDHVLPEDVVVDKDARWGEVPRFQAQRIRDKTVQELIQMIPDGKAAILDMAGFARKDSQGQHVIRKDQWAKLAEKKVIWEIWFRYYDEAAGHYDGGLMFVDELCQHVIFKTRNPNWNYEDYSKAGYCSNLLDFPAPPFFTINYLNDGSSYIDNTSLPEQAATMQTILDRRGFQIMENAEQAGSGLVYNTNMITKPEIAQLVGAPDERVGVKGDVRSAVARVPAPQLPNYVIEDKLDARSEIDNIFATHDITRGEQSGNKTLGQDQIQQGQDYTRMDDIARAVERMATKYYRYLVQMMKVYYTEDHWFKITGEDGQFDQVVMRHDLIEDGVDVAVVSGSNLPVNKKMQQEFVSELLPLGYIDPLTAYEVGTGGILPTPKKMLERLITWKLSPQDFIAMAKSDELDRAAFMDVQVLNAGEMPKVRDEITPEYIAFMNNYMLGGDFEKQPDLVKSLYLEWMGVCNAIATKQLSKMITQAPTPEDMQAAQDKAVAGAQAQSAMMGGAAPSSQQSPPAGGGADLAKQMVAAKGSQVVQ